MLLATHEINGQRPQWHPSERVEGSAEIIYGQW